MGLFNFDPDKLAGSLPFNLGLGILANNYGNYGSFGQAIGRGALTGMQNVQANRQFQADMADKAMQRQLYGQQLNLQKQKLEQDQQDDQIAQGMFRQAFSELGYDPETGGFMKVSGTPQPITSSPLGVPAGEIPLMTEDLGFAPPQPPNPMDTIMGELGWTPGRQQFFKSQLKADPKGAMKVLERAYIEMDRANRSGKREARDVIAKDRAIAEAMGIPLKEYLTNKANKSGVNVTVPVSYGAFTSAVDAQGNPVFIQPSKSGGAPNVVQGFMPADDAAKQRQGAEAARTRLSSLDRLDSDIQDLLEAPGLKYAVGMYSLAPIVPGTAQADAIADIENLASRAAVQAIADMREASKTGGAVGQVTEKEWPKLEAQLANLKRAQSFTKFQTELRKFQDLVRNSKRLIEEAQRKSPMPAARPSQAKPASQPADPLGIRR